MLAFIFIFKSIMHRQIYIKFFQRNKLKTIHTELNFTKEKMRTNIGCLLNRNIHITHVKTAQFDIGHC